MLPAAARGKGPDHDQTYDEGSTQPNTHPKDDE